MLSHTLAIAVVISFSLSSDAGTSCRTKRNVTSDSQSPAPQKGNASTLQLNVLAEGFHSSVTDPFVAVIRDADTYAHLLKLQENLPKLEADFFKSKTVVGAFLGQRNTGGYSVDIVRETSGQIRVSERAPGKGMMVPQIITSPFKVVSVDAGGRAAIQLSTDDRFHQRAQLYRISSGSFTVSGGFTGRSETFPLAGKIQTMRLGDLLTIGFAVVSQGGQRERVLRDSATAVISNDGFEIRKMSHGSLLDPPSGDLQIEGKFTTDNGLTLDIASEQINVPENYSGKGTIEAVMVKASVN